MAPPGLMEHVEIVWEGKGRAAKAYAPGLGCRDTLRLPLADVVALVFRHEGEHLEHNVAEKGAHQILASPGVQKGHVQYGDVHALFLGEHPPLFQNLAVVAPQSVDAFDIQKIIPPQAAQ